MKTRLISITPDAEKLVAYCARVSSKYQNKEDIRGLLGYCLKHGHVSVFETSFATIEITTTRAIETQILRHRSFCFQSFSQRYSNPGDLDRDNPLPSLANSVAELELRLQDTKNRQNSFDVDQDRPDLAKLKARAESLAMLSQTLYDDMIDAGVAKESARFILPGAQPTRLYMSGNLRSWMFYIKTRRDAATQKEHRLIADACFKILSKECPIIFSL